ncbi:hypothetical protein MUP77_13955 [Candidatus Bathyarchaeota archaeon]|nr:hypothetical protein [Candidatus Bathyarchaeota archaeon]
MIAYLKYVPSEDGKWGQNLRRFRRTMESYSVIQVLNNIEMLKTQYPRYVFKSKVMKIQMSAVPHRDIVHHYRPTTALSEIFNSCTGDELEQDVVDFINKLSQESDVDHRNFGVTGSILTGIHNVSFSDMDITVYGLKNSIKVKNSLLQEYGRKTSTINFPQGAIHGRMVRRWAQHYNLPLDEARWFARRKWNRGFFRGRAFSLHPVRSSEEVNEKYGDKAYFPGRIVEGMANIVDAEGSVFLPCVYSLDNVDVDCSTFVNEIVSYDDFYSGVFQVGDTINFRGKLEKVVVKRSGNVTWRVLIGSPEARGFDYIRPKLME